jgi:hypothetical protein
MHSFKDSQGRDWNIAVNVNSAKRVRDGVAGFDLMKVVEDKHTIAKITDDPFTLVAVLYAICQPQAEAASVTPEAFGEAMGGDALDQAATALLADLVDFFPPHRRGPLKAAVETLRTIQAKAAEMATAKIQSPEMMSKVVDILQSHLDSPLSTLGAPSTKTPGLSV